MTTIVPASALENFDFFALLQNNDILKSMPQENKLFDLRKRHLHNKYCFS